MLIAKIIQENVTIEIEELMSNFQYSQNLEMQFVRDENYADGILTGWYKKHKEEEKLLDIAEDGVFTLPADIFTKDGSVQFSFALNYSDKVIHLGVVELYVKRAFGNTVDILPEEAETWISVVTRVAKNAIVDDVELVKEKAAESSNNAKSALESANLAKTSADNASLSERRVLEYVSTAESFKNDASNYADQAGASASNAAENAKVAEEHLGSINTAINNFNTDYIIKKEDIDSAVNSINTTVNNFNTDYTEKINEFNTNYTTKKENFDTAVNNANTALNATITEANTSIANKVVEATEQANRAESEANRAQLATDGKLDKQQGTENAGKAMVVDEDGNVVPGDALPKNVYTQQEVDYLLRDKMDKPYTNIEITEDTSIDCTMDGNFKINTIAGNTVQNVEENIVPTPARPIPIISKKTLVGGEYVELRSLKESENLIDEKLCTAGYIVDSNGMVTPPSTANEIVTDFIGLYGATQLSYRVEGTIIENIPTAKDEKIWIGIGYYDIEKNFISRFTAISPVGAGERVLTNVTNCPSNARYFRFSFRTYEDVKATVVLGNETISSYIAPTVRDYKIVDHTNKKAYIERNIQEINLNDLVYSYGGSNGDSEGVRFYAPVNPQLKYVGEIYSNVFESLSAYNYTKEGVYGGNGQGGKTLSIVVKDSNVTAHTQEALLAYINNPNAVAYYALETPVIEEIEYSADDTSEVGSSFQDSTSPSVSVPSEIKGVNEISIKTTGKNLCSNNISDWEFGHYDINGNKVGHQNRIRLKELIRVHPNTNYYVKCFSDVSSRLILRVYDKNKNLIRNSVSGDFIDITLNSDECYFGVNLYIYGENETKVTSQELMDLLENGVIKPLICLNDGTNDYEPYKESSIQYELDKPLYGNDASNDVITAENRINRFNKFVFDGSSDEIWNFDGYTLNSTIRFYMIFANSGNGAGEGVLKVWCNKFKQRNYDIYDTEYVRISTSTTNQNAYVWVYLKKNRLESLNVVGFRKWLRNNSLEVVLETEFPTIERAPEDLINGLKELRTYSPTTNVFLEGGIKPTLSAQYPKDLALAQEKLEQKMVLMSESLTNTQAKVLLQGGDK